MTSYLGASDVRAVAESLGVRPTKTLGQNFVHDAGTVRKIVRAAGVEPGEWVLEIGPGLGSLTLGLLDAGAFVTAVEIDAALAGALEATIAERVADPARLAVLERDAMAVAGPGDLPVPAALADVGQADAGQLHVIERGPTKLVANLPYNVATPIVLTLLERLPSLTQVLVMVQAEVADRLAAGPDSRTYGAPSAKAAWWTRAARAGTISRAVFWPVPNVDSALVRLERRAPEEEIGGLERTEPLRAATFAVVDAAFSQRRKTLRQALAPWAGSPARAAQILQSAGIDPGARGETLEIADFARIAAAAAPSGASAVEPPEVQP